MQIKDELRVMVEAEVARAVENFKKLDSSIGSTENKTKLLGDALDSIAKKSMVLSGVIGSAAVASVKFAGENEKLKLSLKGMLGSAEEASAVFEDWRKLGTSPGLSADEVFALGRAMVNMGHDTGYATATIKMLGDIAAGTGSSFGTVSGSFERVRAVGKLTTRDLVNLQQQGIPVLNQLAKEFNTSEEGIRKLAEEGKLGFADLERAFKSITSPGGQFSGMMDELSGTTLEKFNTAMDDAKQALASFGELILPVAAELLDGASSMLRGINGMDEGTKRFVIGMGAVTAAAGPAVLAIKGIGAVMAVVAANPYTLAIGGTIAAAGILAGVINKHANAYESLQNEIQKTDNASRKLLAAYADGNYEKNLDEKTTLELIRLYPELSGVISANNTTVKEAVELQKKLNDQKVVDSQSDRIKKLQKDQENLKATLMIISDLEVASLRPKAGLGPDQLSISLRQRVQERDALVKRIVDQQNEINAALSGIGKQYDLYYQVIDIPVSVSVDTSSLGPPPVTPALKKTWQEWFGEITNIDPKSFGNSGAKAAELYIADFSRAFEANKTVFAELGEEFDIAGTLRGQQAEIQKALVELFSVDPKNINESFNTRSKSVEALVAEYKRLGVEAKAAEGAMKPPEKYVSKIAEYGQVIHDLKKKIDDFGKSQSDLARDAANADGALDSQADKIKSLMDEYSRLEILAEYKKQIDEIGKSQNDLAMAAYAAAGASNAQMAEFKKMLNLRDELLQAEKLRETLVGIKDALVNLAFQSTLSGIEELGRALGEGKNAGEAMKNALVAMHQEILNALPNMFLQAGLQLISQGQWALGLGFVAASGSLALIKGYVNKKIEEEKPDVENAHGNVYGASGIQAFSRGGTFTNQVVQNPTLFKFARGTGLMGEAGPEAIIPLARMSNGNLGVQSSGTGGDVIINVVNKSGAETDIKETRGADDSRQIEITIGDMINKHLVSGKADRVIGGRYGLNVKGV